MGCVLSADFTQLSWPRPPPLACAAEQTGIILPPEHPCTLVLVIAPQFSFGKPPPVLSLHSCNCVGHPGVGRGSRLGEQGPSPGILPCHGELGWPFGRDG